MRPIRVAYPASMTSGGSERQMLMLAANLPRDRFAVEFLVLGGSTPQSDEARDLGVPVHVLGVSRAGRHGPLATGRAAALAIARFARTVRGRQYDIVDAWLFHAYVLAALTRPLTRVPVLIAGRRITTAGRDAGSALERTIDALASRAADAIVANSDDVARDVIANERLDPRKVRVIRNAVAPPRPQDPGARAAARRSWRVGDDDVVLGVVANFRPQKRLDVLVAALAAAPLPAGVRVVFVGDGPCRPAITAQVAAAGIADRVRFTGLVPDARPLMAGFDVLVSSSRAEGLSNSLLEAGAAGLPVVATRAGGSAEVVVHGETGLLVPTDDAPALRAALDVVLGDADLRRRMGAAAAADVERRFGVDRLVRETGELYESLAEARGIRR